MNIAVLNQTLCIDVAIFEDLNTAQEFLGMGVWPEATGVVELAEGFRIGDNFIDGEWVSQPEPVPEPPAEPPDPDAPDYMAFIAGLMEGYSNEQ